MKRIVEVKPATSDSGSFQVQCRFDQGDKTYILTAEDNMEVYPRNSKDIPQELNINMGRNGKMKLTYEYDDLPNIEDMSDVDVRKKKVVTQFWQNYPLATINGKSHAGTKLIQLDVEDMISKQTAVYEKWKLQYKVARMIDEMKPEVLLNVAYYYGVTPGTKRGDVVLSLADWTTGRIFLTPGGGEEFLTMWSKESDRTRDMAVIVNKAIKYGIIRNQKEANLDNYYIGTQRIGSRIEDVMDYCNRNEKMYVDHVEREVKDKEEDDISKFKTQSGKVDADSKTASKGGTDLAGLSAMRQELITLRDQGFADPSIDPGEMDVESIKAAIKEASGKKRKAANVKI